MEKGLQNLSILLKAWKKQVKALQSLEFSDQNLKLIKYVITDDQINDKAINELNRTRKLSMELTKTFYFTE